MDQRNIRKLILILSAAIVSFLVTWLCRVDIDSITLANGNPAGAYINLGDIVIYIGVFVVGGPWMALACAVGSLFADIAVGSPQYIVGSMLIKAGMALFLGRYSKHCDTWKRALVVAAIAESIMVLGYFVFNLVIRTQPVMAFHEIGYDLLQGVVCGAIGMVLLRLMPKLHLRGLSDHDDTVVPVSRVR